MPAGPDAKQPPWIRPRAPCCAPCARLHQAPVPYPEFPGCVTLGSGRIAATVYPQTEHWPPGVPRMICA